jgi:hypothetical protein
MPPWSTLAWTLSDEMPHVRHQHIAAEPCDQRFLAIAMRSSHSASVGVREFIWTNFAC